MKLLYKPFGLAAKMVGTRVGKQAFAGIWSAVSSQPKPRPGEPDVSLTRAVVAAAIEGATLAAAAAAVNVVAARVFHHLVGIWPDRPTADQNS